MNYATYILAINDKVLDLRKSDKEHQLYVDNPIVMVEKVVHNEQTHYLAYNSICKTFLCQHITLPLLTDELLKKFHDKKIISICVIENGIIGNVCRYEAIEVK